MTDSEQRWERKDVFLGLLFVATGVLVTTYAALATQGGLLLGPTWLAWILGPLFLGMGVNAVCRSLRGK